MVSTYIPPPNCVRAPIRQSSTATYKHRRLSAPEGLYVDKKWPLMRLLPQTTWAENPVAGSDKSHGWQNTDNNL